ncbi:CRISPR-associated protein Cas5 [Candidatus Contubernalis alkalaceticus]
MNFGLRYVSFGFLGLFKNDQKKVEQRSYPLSPYPTFF